MNVIGTMQLLAACQKSATVTRLIVKSTGAVYGASPLDQAMFTERDEPNAIPASGYAKDAVEIEGYIRGFARRRDDVDVTVLRFASIIGPHVDTVLTRYFSLPVVPTVLGYDGRLQLLHEQDALAVLERATERGYRGFSTSVGTGYCWCHRRSAGSAGFRSPYRGRPWTPSAGCCTVRHSLTTRRSKPGSSTSDGCLAPPGCAALRTQTMIIPCSIVGAEEIYPMIGDITPDGSTAAHSVFTGDAVVPVARATTGNDPATVEVVHRVR
jgi:NAD dependent epimerase/dehydratase family